MNEIGRTLAQLEDGVVQVFAHDPTGLTAVVVYRREQAYGDNNMPVRGVYTGEFTLAWNDQNPAPATWRHGPAPDAKAWIAEAVGKVITSRLAREHALAGYSTRPVAPTAHHPHDAGLAGDIPKVAVGDRVMHRGTRQWGTVVEVRPQRNGSSELLVQRDDPLIPGFGNEPTWWAIYHLDWGAMQADRIGR